MAVVERSIIAGGGGDYTTIAAWESATNLNAGTDIWKGVIEDNSNYNESVTFLSTGGSITSHQWLTVAGDNHHAGVWDTGKARIIYDGTNTAAITFNDPYGFVEWLQIQRTGVNLGVSDEAVRNDDDHCLVSRCIIWCDDLTETENDGINMNSGFRDAAAGATAYYDHCIIYGWQRMGIFVNFCEADQTVHVDHCMIVYNRDTTQTLGYAAQLAVLSSASTVFGSYDVYNTNLATMIDPKTLTETAEINYAPAITVGALNGSHNVRTDSTTPNDVPTDNSTNWQDATDGTTDSAPATAGAYVTDFTGVTTFDLTPVPHANNVLLGNGTNRQGSEPDARQDFSTDITGKARPTTNVDIGPFQISGDGGIVPHRLNEARRHLLTR